MRKSLLSMFLLFAIGMTANAQKFALIDMEYILKNIPAYQSATEELDQASRLKSWAKKPKVCMIAIRHLLRPFPTHRSQRKKKRLLPKKNQQRNYAVNTSVPKANSSKSAKP